MPGMSQNWEGPQPVLDQDLVGS